MAWDRLVPKARLGSKGHRGFLAHPVPKDHLVLRASQGLQESLERPGSLDPRESRERAHRGLLGSLGHLVRPVRAAQQV